MGMGDLVTLDKAKVKSGGSFIHTLRSAGPYRADFFASLHLSEASIARPPPNSLALSCNALQNHCGLGGKIGSAHFFSIEMPSPKKSLRASDTPAMNIAAPIIPISGYVIDAENNSAAKARDPIK